jgi:rhomboid protease GluP
VQEIPEPAGPDVPPRTFYEVLVRATPRFWVTPALITANVAYFAVAAFHGVSPIQPDPQQLLELGANFGPLTLQGQWWRLVSATFVHIGFVHLAFNMWCLWSLGNVAERMFGNFTFFWIYLLSGIGGSLASLIWHPSIVSAGASGAIFGIAGALASMLYFGHILVPRQVVRELLSSLAFFVGFNLLFGFLLQGIDNAGHIGGLVVGLGLGAALHRPLPQGRRPWHRFLAVPATALLFAAVARIAVEKGVDDPELMAARARQLESEGKADAAVSELERALALDPDFTEGQIQLGLVHLQAGRFAEAIPALERAAALSPKSAEIRTTLGFAYLRAERYDEAISTFEQAIDLDPELYEPQRNLAIALRYANRLDEAAEAFRIARRMEPSDVSLYVDSSQLLMEAGRLDEAVSVLEEALTWAPESAPVESQMGLVRLRRGETELALEALRRASALEPDEPEHHNRLALARSRAREGDCGLGEIQKALELRPEAPHLLDSLGTVRLARGEPAEAIAAYRRALALAPDQAVYRFNLSVALARGGATREAETERAEALRLDPNLAVPEDDLPII